MSTDVTLANKALSNIGAEGLIETLDENTDDSEEVRHVNIHLDDCRRLCLRNGEWGFATEFVALAGTGSDPVVTRWQYMYQYPSGNYLRMVKIINPADPNKKIDFVRANDPVHGQVIYTNQEEAVAQMVADITDLSQFDDDAFTALSWLLSYMIATPLGAGATQATNALRTYNALIATAKTNDANESEDQNNGDIDASWIEARY